MKNKLIILSLLVFLLTGLSTSSFFLDKYLTNTIIKNEYNNAQFNFAIKHGNLSALHIAIEQSLLHGEEWLKLMKILAETQGKPAYILANYYQSEPKRAIFWYKAAIRLSYIPAYTALAQYYFIQEELSEASQILSSIPKEKLTTEHIIVIINIAINQGRVRDVIKLISQYQKQLELIEEGQLLLSKIIKYQITSNSNQYSLTEIMANQCDNSIQLFATNLKHLNQLEQLIKGVKAQPINKFVCFSPIRYMAVDSLDCTNEKNKAIQCNEVNWGHWSESINTRYVGIMLPQGGANVHLGIIYIDAKDTADVLAHEISHLLGFVDEYPLPSAHVKCQAIQGSVFSPNISVLNNYYEGSRETIRANIIKQVSWGEYINVNTPVLQEVMGLDGKLGWKLGTPKSYSDDVGIFKALSCDNSSEQLNIDFSAFKAVSYRTKLQYFALDFPELYSNLIEDNPTKYIMPSFHYNIAVAYAQKHSEQQSLEQNNIEIINVWLEQAEGWEQSIERRKRLRQGAY
jgi:hypothetical protein